MAKYKVEISGIDTSKIPVLNSQEMNQLFEQYKNGDASARNRLVEGNLKLVLSILKRFHHHVDNMDDLFQIGCVGLLKAIDNFDLSHGVKFSTYAVPMILGEVRRYLRDNNSVRVSRSMRELAYKVLKYQEQYYLKNGIESSLNDVSKELDVSVYDIVQALESLRDPISIFEPIYSDGGDTIYLVDQIEDKSDTATTVSMRISLDDAISELDERSQYILDERFVLGKTQMEIAQDLNISQAQVSRIEKGAVKQLKKNLR